MKRKILHAILPLAVCLFAACNRSEPVNDDYGLSTTLSWADKDDVNSEIKDVKLWVYTSGGQPVDQKQYDGKHSMALDIRSLPAGEYHVVAAVNLAAPFEAQYTTRLSDMQFTFGEAESFSSHAYYAVAAISLPSAENTRVPLPLRRMLAEFTVRVEGVPQGAVLETTLVNATRGVCPAKLDVGGSWGVAVAQVRTFRLPDAVAQGDVIVARTAYVPPTAGNDAYTRLRFRLLLPGGEPLESRAEAPPMKPGGKYTLYMDYTGIKPFMHVTPVSVTDWEEGWEVSGEISDPDRE